MNNKRPYSGQGDERSAKRPRTNTHPNTTAKAITLVSNFFQVQVPSSQQLYLYDVQVDAHVRL